MTPKLSEQRLSLVRDWRAPWALDNLPFECRSRCVAGLRRLRFSSGATHYRHLVLPFRDDALSQTPKLLIMTVFELGASGIDGALMVGHHYGDEIAIDVARRIGHHT